MWVVFRDHALCCCLGLLSALPWPSDVARNSVKGRAEPGSTVGGARACVLAQCFRFILCVYIPLSSLKSRVISQLRSSPGTAPGVLRHAGTSHSLSALGLVDTGISELLTKSSCCYNLLNWPF